MSRTEDEAIVLELLALVGGEASAADALRLLAPGVVCHMGPFTARGAGAWTDWVAFIRSRGVENVRAVVERVETGDDGIVTVRGGLVAGRGARPASRAGTARYRVVEKRVSEIWTDRWNYEIIFGANAAHPVRWLLVLAWMALWRRLPWRCRALTSDPRGVPGDGGRRESRRGGQAHDDPGR